MGISKKLLEEQESEDYLEEYIYLQALYQEWEQWEWQEMMKEKGRIHSSIPKENIQHNESNSEYSKLPF